MQFRQSIDYVINDRWGRIVSNCLTNDDLPKNLSLITELKIVNCDLTSLDFLDEMNNLRLLIINNLKNNVSLLPVSRVIKRLKLDKVFISDENNLIGHTAINYYRAHRNWKSHPYFPLTIYKRRLSIAVEQFLVLLLKIKIKFYWQKFCLLTNRD